MQLSLLLLLQHSHSLSTLPVVDIKSLQTKVQASSPDVGATGTYIGVSLTLLFFFNTLPNLGPLNCKKAKCSM
jgi:hypothetical protein